VRFERRAFSIVVLGRFIGNPNKVRLGVLNWRLLPWEYGVRNLFRRPTRSGLTLLGLATVGLLVFVVVAFVRGLDVSLTASGDPHTVLVYSIGAAGDIENSAIAARTPALLSASLGGIERRYGVSYVSPELYVATKVATHDGGPPRLSLLRGVTPAAALLRKQVQIVDGNWPGPGEVLIGRLAATKLGCRPAALALGETITLDGRSWRIGGQFVANGTAFESEMWCPLPDLQQALKRQDLSLVAVGLARGASATDVEMFCKERVDLELQGRRPAKAAGIETGGEPPRGRGGRSSESGPGKTASGRTRGRGGRTASRTHDGTGTHDRPCPGSYGPAGPTRQGQDFHPS
jgi:hypothetical protein